jgi:hypothetical protein
LSGLSEECKRDQMMTDRCGIQTLQAPGELNLATADSLAAQGCTALGRHTRLKLLDLTGLSFCGARGLNAFVQIANHATRHAAAMASSRHGRWWRRYCGSPAWTIGCRYSRPSTTARCRAGLNASCFRLVAGRDEQAAMDLADCVIQVLGGF